MCLYIYYNMVEYPNMFKTINLAHFCCCLLNYLNSKNYYRSKSISKAYLIELVDNNLLDEESIEKFSFALTIRTTELLHFLC